jgi:hypothetical protein
LPRPPPPAPLHRRLHLPLASARLTSQLSRPRQARLKDPRVRGGLRRRLPIVRKGRPGVLSARPGSPPGQRCSRGGERSRLARQLFALKRLHKNTARLLTLLVAPSPLFSAKLRGLPGRGFYRVLISRVSLD